MLYPFDYVPDQVGSLYHLQLKMNQVGGVYLLHVTHQYRLLLGWNIQLVTIVSLNVDNWDTKILRMSGTILMLERVSKVINYWLYL